MKKASLFLIGCALLVGLSTSTARAFPEFFAEFKAKYVKEKPETDAEKALAEKVEKVKCNVCHMGKEKKPRNNYGKHLEKHINKGDKKNKEKIQKGLDTVYEEKVSEDEDKTFGDLIKAGDLPGGEG